MQKPVAKSQLAHVGQDNLTMNKPKYQEGNIVYYGGTTGLFKITFIVLRGDGDHRYYGEHYFGGVIGRYESAIRLAAFDEIPRPSTQAVARWVTDLFDKTNKEPTFQ